MNIDNRHTRSTVKLPAIKDPFYRKVTCSKFLGGTLSLWHSHLKDEHRAEYGLAPTTTITGAGGTAELAIADLAKQLREYAARASEKVAATALGACSNQSHEAL
jgi:hypothetical protein